MQPINALHLFALVFAHTTASGVATAKPVRIFLLAGQSNMEGHGSLDHLDALVHHQQQMQDEENPYRTLLWDDLSDSYRVGEDIFLKFHEHYGNLAVRRDGSFAGCKEMFGPDLSFGFTMGDILDNETILMIKTAWGGKNLAVDFRPPSSSKNATANYETKCLAPKLPEHVGLFYRQMLDDIRDTLDHIATYVPGYDEEVGYSVEGMVWFQGWNDFLCREESFEEYGWHLGNLIRDLRHGLNLPGLPFLVGEFGMHGIDQTDERILGFRAAQEGVTLEEEFRNNTLFIKTSSYAVLEGETFEGIYHYNGRADTYFHIGQAFARGMLHMMKENEVARDSS